MSTDAKLKTFYNIRSFEVRIMDVSNQQKIIWTIHNFKPEILNSLKNKQLKKKWWKYMIFRRLRHSRKFGNLSVEAQLLRKLSFLFFGRFENGVWKLKKYIYTGIEMEKL